MVDPFEVAGGLVAPAADLDVVLGALPLGHAGLRDVGDVAHRLADLRLDLALPAVELVDAALDGGHFVHGGLGVAARALQFADLLGGGVAAGLEFLHFGQDLLAAVVEGQNGADVGVHALGFGLGLDFVGIFAKAFDV